MKVDLISAAMAGVDQQKAAAAFETRVAEATGRPLPSPQFATAMQAAIPGSGVHGHGSSDKNKAMLALEGTLMSKMVDAMMPKDQHGLYGGGAAGDTWRSFEVDQLGQTVAKSDLLHFAQSGGEQPRVSLFGSGPAASSTDLKITPFST